VIAGHPRLSFRVAAVEDGESDALAANCEQAAELLVREFGRGSVLILERQRVLVPVAAEVNDVRLELVQVLEQVG
jgi:hypothetical protein